MNHTFLRKPRTRIVATVGPTCNTEEMLTAVNLAGASVFRLNFSHGTHAEHAQAVKRLRDIAQKCRKPIGILADLSGPKLRIGAMPGGEVELKEGDEFRLTSEPEISEPGRVSVNFDDLHEVIAPGRSILLDDGNVQLIADRIEGRDVVCRVADDCALRSRKGVNLPDTHLPIPALTDKDRADLKFALESGVEYVALSFVRKVKDLEDAREAMKEVGIEVPLIAKIEMGEALNVLDEILEYADGAMVARGDLGVEVPIEELPAIQRRVISICNDLGKPVITATQMLNSMIEHPRPTRAEVTDIYNAIMQGTDAVMLSGETAYGAHPLESVEMMARIAREAEQDMKWSRFDDVDTEKSLGIREAICSAAVHIAEDLEVDAILCASHTGSTARRIARYRPKCRIYCFSNIQRTVNKMTLCWGVQTRQIRSTWDSEEEMGLTSAIINIMLKTALSEGLVMPGMRVVITGGLPLDQTGSTNFLHVVEVPYPGE